MKKTKPAKPPSEEFRRFEQFTKALMAVPKKEIDQGKVRKAEDRKEKESRVTFHNRRARSTQSLGVYIVTV